ncbi:hypothetical protein N658DRAFT_26188 [Parathielavia hyrcaniae]|uniref:Uncharacterized protein n=1 Tax=Parathielavia hyrcaniae TaxID=113614 RepID=A0AAN6QAJ4_9PEZI|nr:hypothetical protein N658DRAFT_26188 [Parathielavia hyrcaniae]
MSFGGYLIFSFPTSLIWSARGVSTHLATALRILVRVSYHQIPPYCRHSLELFGLGWFSGSWVLTEIGWREWPEALFLCCFLLAGEGEGGYGLGMGCLRESAVAASSFYEQAVSDPLLYAALGS